jgi:hypothetical protein
MLKAFEHLSSSPTASLLAYTIVLPCGFFAIVYTGAVEHLFLIFILFFFLKGFPKATAMQIGWPPYQGTKI